MLRKLLQLSLKREQRDDGEREERAKREKREKEEREDVKHEELLRAILALAGSRSDTPIPKASPLNPPSQPFSPRPRSPPSETLTNFRKRFLSCS